MRKAMVQAILFILLFVVITGLYRRNALLRTQLAILKQAPNRISPEKTNTQSLTVNTRFTR
jgi:hypothetical protein